MKLASGSSFARPSRPVLSIALSTALALGALTLGGCAAPTGANEQAAAAKDQVQFLDIASFDKTLSASLSAPLAKVDVAFVDVVKPSAMPERLQKWMASVEAGGGKVSITEPKSELQGRSVFALVSAATTLWSASKMAASFARDSQFKAAQAYNAEIVLKRDTSGDSVVDKVVFTKR